VPKLSKCHKLSVAFVLLPVLPVLFRQRALELGNQTVSREGEEAGQSHKPSQALIN